MRKSLPKDGEEKKFNISFYTNKSKQSKELDKTDDIFEDSLEEDSLEEDSPEKKAKD